MRHEPVSVLTARSHLEAALALTPPSQRFGIFVAMCIPSLFWADFSSVAAI
jgi:hypothetical protein